MSRATTMAKLGGAVGSGVVGGLGVTAARFHLEQRRAQEEWESSEAKHLEGFGQVESLSILPLIDWHSASPELEREPGVSYLILADDTTILFDLGFNQKKLHPSPLLRNMEAMGVRPEDVDMVFISHAHADHTGGIAAQKAGTFHVSPGGQWIGQIPAFLPEPRKHPAARTKVVRAPQVLAPGVASTGTIPRALWLVGLVREQALVVNVAGMGLVIIAGCGHQGLDRLLRRVHALSDEPIHGFIGGLHLPVTGSRMPLGAQRVIGTGKLPWNPLTKEDAREAAEILRKEEPRLVSLSPHDSCDWSIDLFQRVFVDRYQDLLVGKEISIGAEGGS